MCLESEGQGWGEGGGRGRERGLFWGFFEVLAGVAALREVELVQRGLLE